MADITGNCPGCIYTFKKLDELLEAAVNREVEITGADKVNARLHALAAVESWWLDRMLTSLPDRTQAIEVARRCLASVVAEQRIRL